ncbi:MAG: 5-formyltetrahydrofolate cyclo-ligase [Candidatus Methanomethylicia archaeon]|nr:5-formyltetrahydrofolate cyclo-ligase [Candidatus Methanomethylicia archaeon]
MNIEKQKIREEIWRKMEEKGIAVFPGAYGRIPNFVGAEEAAEKLAQLSIWKEANIIKVNPDSPQKPVRRNALNEGKILIMPTPRISSGFLMLDPRRIDKKNYDYACTIKGAFKYGVEIKPENLQKIDLVVVGSVAVNIFGDRIGKGEGYSEIEWGIVSEYGKVNDKTPIVTTVHDIQIVDYKFKIDPYDVPVDIIITPTKIITTNRVREKPKGIYWELMDGEKIQKISLLKEMYNRINRRN